MVVNINTEFTEFDRYGKGNIFIMKLDNMGDIIFNKIWGDDFDIVGEGIAISESNEVYLSGYDDYSGNRTMILLKLNSNGEEIWIKSWSKIDSSINTAIDSSILLSISFNSDNVLYGLGIKDDFYANDYNPLLLEFDF